jgi:hypothetical protein
MLPIFMRHRVVLGGLAGASLSAIITDTNCGVDKASIAVLGGMYGAWIPYIFNAAPGAALLLPAGLVTYYGLKALKKSPTKARQ